MFNIFGEALWLILDKLTDKVADYIKFKELEKRIDIKEQQEINYVQSKGS